MTQLDKQTIVLDVDGETIEVAVRPHHLLLDALRDGCGRTSVKEGCESASCGACTVLIDGEPKLACLTLALDAVGHTIRTAQGLSLPDGSLHPLQEAFVKHHAIQCGFCTPGMLLSAASLLERTLAPTEEQIRSALSGNLCRCTGYTTIVEAVSEAAKSMQDAKR